ncbi:MAG: hypothetical protein ACF788_09940, partial [Novipirellula sp. JB048]
LTKDKLQTPVGLGGEGVNVSQLQEQHARYSKRCQTQLGHHACREVRAWIAAHRQPDQQPRAPAVIETRPGDHG